MDRGCSSAPKAELVPTLQRPSTARPPPLTEHYKSHFNNCPSIPGGFQTIREQRTQDKATHSRGSRAAIWGNEKKDRNQKWI